VHLAGVAGRQPLGEAIDSWWGCGWANTAQVETHSPGFGFQIGSERIGGHVGWGLKTVPLDAIGHEIISPVVTGFAAVYCRGWFESALKQH
jgi:hypothetical protein